MNYYSSLQRQSEGYAARVFEELYAVPSHRRAAAAFLAATIRRGGATTSAWSITLDPASVRVNIGPVQLLSLWRGRLWFCASGRKLVRGPSWLKDVSRGPMVYPRSVNILSRGYEVRAPFIGRIPPRVREAALEYVGHAAARRRGRSSWERSHSPGVLFFLESFLGIELPRPSVVTHDRLSAGNGLPGEIEPTEIFAEGSATRVLVNSYERNREARAHHALRIVLHRVRIRFPLNLRAICGRVHSCSPYEAPLGDRPRVSSRSGQRLAPAVSKLPCRDSHRRFLSRD